MIAIVDSGVANLASLGFALERLGKDFVVTDNPDLVERASHVILPGVGAASAAMPRLRQKGMAKRLEGLTQPVLGICLGMQLLFTHSEEGRVDLLNIIPGKIEALHSAPQLVVPHMGWNKVRLTRASALLTELPDSAYFYFAHSYVVPLGDYTLATTFYGENFSSLVVRDNFFGCQFHPERSGPIGQQLLANFVGL